MSFSVIPTDKFKKEAKRLIKKYHSLKSELLNLNQELSYNPSSGTSLGNNTFKIRIAIKSKGAGKSGGAGNHLPDNRRPGNIFIDHL